MYSGKKITKEDTWRSDDLIRHMRSQEEERRRRERSQRDPERERRKHREESGRRGEVRDERERERGEAEHRDREKERQRDRDKDRDREKEKERDRDGLRERGKERDKEKDLEREKRNREKDRDRNKERDREKEGGREKGDRGKDGERQKREREKDREREKGDREKDRERQKREKEKERDRLREGGRDRGEERDREKDRERERRRAERENERRKEKEISIDGDDKFRERERDRKERHREREHHRGGEEQDKERREQERREKHGHRQHTGKTDGEERREWRRREIEQHVKFNHEDGEIEQRYRRQAGDGVMEREERDKRREQRNDDSNPRPREHESKHSETEQEDYEEDFEEFDEDKEEEEEVRESEKREAEPEMSPRSRREVEDIRRAMEKENELLGTARSTPSTQGSEISDRVSADSRKSRTYGRVIDFTAARQREINQEAADKQKKRSTELLRLIELDYSVTESLLDLPPVREYDLYIKSYGTANTKQAYVQCNEDNIERDTQTDEADIADKWTQHPPETSVACGDPQISHNASGESVTRMSVDSKRLAAFLSSATQVMAVLLEENIAESNSVKKLQSHTHTLSFSDGCVHLNTQLNFLQGRQVTLLHFSQTQTHTLLSVHSPHSGSSDVTLDSKTLMCVWNIWEPSTPQRILVCEAEVRSCCFSPGKAALVFAGTDVGSVLVWDLREHSGSHSHVRVCEEEWTLRHPTFSTDAVLSGAGHFSSVVSVEPVLVNVGAGLRDPLLPDQEESLGLSFQLGSLDENGLLNLWVVVELPKADDSGSQTDLGLRPGGKVKLLHSSSLQTTPQLDKGVIGVTSHLRFVLKFLPSDSNHYFIGSNMGLVRHGTRHGLRAVPKLYRPKDGERLAEVTALEFCPTGEPFFLVGCSDGSVRLHALVCEEAVCEWTLGSGRAAVQCLHFSPTRCSVFCALDSASVLHIWDLTQRDESPLLTQDLHTDPVSAMAVSGDASTQNPYSSIALAKDSGRLEIHFLLPSLTLPQASDTGKLHSLAQDTL
ncbi:cytoplasmic dynein 2 intermediate chain 1 isoform X3 [Ictalurus furcatus]|uniref:cytoplasmic dynein 2 intermediate chain 1 isoform X3 n=1 Tax=Ictalurus furcatus TaxID=66913 RepID=UPI00235045BF|nr:cytoplasmic dynein 2 intermediate chain 1 isoform X3 [Ictalurus furcatus]